MDSCPVHAAAAENPSVLKSDNQWRKRVRVVGRISPSSDSENSQSWISVLKSGGESSGCAAIVFRNREEATGHKESYKLDWCYEQDDKVDKIFSEEVKPLIQGIYQGADTSIFAFGAKGSGKTLLIEGCEEKPGLAALAMAEILRLSEEITRDVKLSCYEVYQDRVFDAFEHSEQEVQILESASGRTQLKGLSQVPLKSILDFNRLYFHGRKQRKSSQKPTDDITFRSHKGMIIYVSSLDKESGVHLVGRMHFVDLAGYVDIKQMINAKPHFLETSRINRSLYALQNVVCALNANENHIPYRESKLTHLLKVFRSKEKSQALMIMCLKPTPCEETIQALSMASRSCMISNCVHLDSTKKSKGIVRPSSQQYSPSAIKSHTYSSLVKKHGTSRLGSEKKTNGHDKKLNGTPSAIRARKLFPVKSPIAISTKDKQFSGIAMEAELIQNEDKQLSCVPLEAEMLIQNEDKNQSDVFLEAEPLALEQKKLLLDEPSEVEASTIPEGVNGAVEIYGFLTNTCESSPPISERLKEISNTLKFLSCQPINIVSPSTNVDCSNHNTSDAKEPKTPGFPFSLRANDKLEIEMSGTPHDIFKTRSVGLKNSLVQELLTYLNSATKEELKQLKGIGEKRATYIVELREESPLRDVNDLKEIGLSSKQVKDMMRHVMGEFYT